MRRLPTGSAAGSWRCSADKYLKMTGVSKATATRDLSALVASGLLWLGLLFVLVVVLFPRGVAGRLWSLPLPKRLRAEVRRGD